MKFKLQNEMSRLGIEYGRYSSFGSEVDEYGGEWETETDVYYVRWKDLTYDLGDSDELWRLSLEFDGKEFASRKEANKYIREMFSRYPMEKVE